MPNPDGTLTPEEEEAARAAAGVPSPVALPQQQAASDYRNISSNVESLAETKDRLDEARYGGLGKEDSGKLLHAMFDDAMGKSTDDAKAVDPKTGRLVSTKPSWYGASTAPTHQPAWQRGLSGGLGVLAAGAQKNADVSAGTAGRPLSLKQHDQGKANVVGLLSGFGQAYLNKPQADEKQDLDTAVKQAQMYRILNPSRAGGAGSHTTQLKDVAGYSNQIGNLGARTTIAAANAQRDTAAAQKKVDEDTATSPVSIENATVAAKFGAIPESEIGKISLRALRQNQPFLQLEKSQEFQLYMSNHRAELASIKHANETNDAQAAVVAKEDRARAQSQIDSRIKGVTWDGGPDYVPPPKLRDEVQALVSSRETSLGAIHDIKAGIAHFKEKYKSGFGNWVSSLRLAVKTGAKINFDAEDEPWISKINIARDQLGADQRIRNGMKAPQGIELKLTNELVNSDATVGGLLFPDEFYNGLADGLNKSTARGIKARFGTFNPDSSAPTEPNEKLRKTYNVQPVEFTGGQERPGRRPFSVAPQPSFSGEQPPAGEPEQAPEQVPQGAVQAPEQAPQAPQAAAKRPAPAPVQLPEVPVVSDRLSTAQMPPKPNFNQPAPAAQKPEAKRRYNVVMPGSKTAELHELTPAEVQELTDIKATVTPVEMSK